MLNYEEELSKFSPVVDIDDVENSIESDELRDVMDLLNYLSIKG